MREREEESVILRRKVVGDRNGNKRLSWSISDLSALPIVKTNSIVKPKYHRVRNASISSCSLSSASSNFSLRSNGSFRRKARIPVTGFTERAFLANEVKMRSDAEIIVNEDLEYLAKVDNEDNDSDNRDAEKDTPAERDLNHQINKHETMKNCSKELVKKDADETRKRKVFRRHGCQECAELCTKSKKFRFHYVDVHSFDVVRGLSIGGKGKFVQFMSHELLLEKKEALKNQFDIQIPPPEFTKEEFDSCNIEEIISNCLLTDLSTKVKQIGKRSDNFVCLSCKYQFKSINQHKEHYIKYHRMKFKCPKENCNHNKNQDISLIDFVKHLYFHA